MAEAIHVYWYGHSVPSKEFSSWPDLLDKTELETYHSIERPEVAESFAYRRSLLRRLLARHSGTPADQLTFDTEPHGKPSLIDTHHKLHFNTSQTRTSGLISIGDQGPVGIDIEIMRQLDAAAFSEKILSPSERIEFAALCSKDRLSTIFGYWTAKEAMIKAIGLGLNLNLLRQISVPLSPPNMLIKQAEWLPVKLTGPLEGHGEWYICTQFVPAPFPHPAIFSVASQKKLRLNIHQVS